MAKAGATLPADGYTGKFIHPVEVVRSKPYVLVLSKPDELALSKPDAL